MLIGLLSINNDILNFLVEKKWLTSVKLILLIAKNKNKKIANAYLEKDVVIYSSVFFFFVQPTENLYQKYSILYIIYMLN